MAAAKPLMSAIRSCDGGRRRPRLMGLGPELAEGRATDQEGLDVEDVVDGGMG